MATYSNLNSLFKDIANSIRSKTGSTAAIVANNFPTAINAISTGTNTADANATAADILSPKTAYVNGSKLTGTIATKTASNLSASGATVTAEAGYYASAVSKSVSSGSATTPATTVYTGKVGMSFNASNGVVTASSVSGTASVTPTVSAGYVSAGTAGTITATSNANTYSVGLASINAPSGSKQQSTPTVTLYANGLISATSAATSGTAYANVATAGYIAAGAKSGTFSLTASAAGTKQLTTKAGGTTTITGNTKIVASQTFTTGDVYATVAAATRSAGTAAVLNNSNGNVRYYVNTTAGYTAANTSAYYLQLNTKAGGTTTVTTTESTLINAGQFAVGAIKAKAAAGTLAAGTAAVLNNSNGNIRYYRNVSAAGYIAANTTAYYLQLNTKAGGTTTVGESETTLINAGQFAIGAIKAKSGPTLKIGDLSPTTGTGMVLADGSELTPSSYTAYSNLIAPLYTSTTLKVPPQSGSYYSVSKVHKIYDYYYCFASEYVSSTYYVYLYRTSNLTTAPMRVETVWSTSSLSSTGFCSDMCVHGNKIYFITYSSKVPSLNIYTVAANGTYTKTAVALSTLSGYNLPQYFIKNNTCYWNGNIIYYLSDGSNSSCVAVVCNEAGFCKICSYPYNGFSPGSGNFLLDEEHGFLARPMCATTGSSYTDMNMSFYSFYDMVNGNNRAFITSNLGVSSNVSQQPAFNRIVRTGNRIWLAFNYASGKHLRAVNIKDFSCFEVLNRSYDQYYNFGLNVVGDSLYLTAQSNNSYYYKGTSRYNGFITYIVGENTVISNYLARNGYNLPVLCATTSYQYWNVYYKYLVGAISANTYTAYNVVTNKIVKVPDIPEMYIKVS